VALLLPPATTAAATASYVVGTTAGEATMATVFNMVGHDLFIVVPTTDKVEHMDATRESNTQVGSVYSPVHWLIRCTFSVNEQYFSLTAN